MARSSTNVPVLADDGIANEQEFHEIPDSKLHNITYKPTRHQHKWPID